MGESTSLQAFYSETLPEKRKLILEELSENNEISNEDLIYIQSLYEKRYESQNGRIVDTFLYLCIEFCGIYRSLGFFRGGAKRSVRKYLEHIDAFANRTKDQETLYFNEIKNVFYSYFQTCAGSHYRKKFFGLKDSSESEKRLYMLEDTWSMSYGLAKELGLMDKMAIWVKAAKESYESIDEEAKDEWKNWTKKKG